MESWFSGDLPCELIMNNVDWMSDEAVLYGLIGRNTSLCGPNVQARGRSGNINELLVGLEGVASARYLGDYMRILEN